MSPPLHVQSGQVMVAIISGSSHWIPKPRRGHPWILVSSWWQARLGCGTFAGGNPGNSRQPVETINSQQRRQSGANATCPWSPHGAPRKIAVSTTWGSSLAYEKSLYNSLSHSETAALWSSARFFEVPIAVPRESDGTPSHHETSVRASKCHSRASGDPWLNT